MGLRVDSSGRLLAALILGAVLPAARPLRAQKCETARPLSDQESSFLADERRALRELVPEAPSGWLRRPIQEVSSAGPVCDDPGYKPPLIVRVSAVYLPVDAPELTADQRAAASAAYQSRLEAASREEAEAVKSGDAARIERARKAARDLRAHPVPTPARAPQRSARRLEVRLQVNPASDRPCANADSIEIEGAASAFRARGTTCRDRAAADVFLVAFGAWKARPGPTGAVLAGFNEWPGPAVARAAAHTVLAEIFGDPDAVDSVGRRFDPLRLRALLGPKTQGSRTADPIR